MMIYHKRAVFSLIFFLLSLSIAAQKPVQLNASEILHHLEKLNVLGGALYLAAHPDDENQRVITYMANEIKVRSAYLSLTRGDGGQNLIGPEIFEKLGLIRTQELLEARRRDGGEQFFTRAVDFGYSKNPEETLTIWDKEKVLADVVWTYRKFRPDVVITRFPTDGRGRHGHHTASALLALEAFELSGDPNAFPEQLELVEPWQPKRIFWNTSVWWYRNGGFDTTAHKVLNVGMYNPLLGQSYNEIAANSRSQHKSQGFGATGSRGDQIEYLEHLAGGEVEDDVFEGIELSWNRVKGGQKIGEAIEALIANYDIKDPAASVEGLLKIRSMVEGMNDEFWKNHKLRSIDRILKSMLGLYLEATSDQQYLIKGGDAYVQLEAVNRSMVPVSIKSIAVSGLDYMNNDETTLGFNQSVIIDLEGKLTDAVSITQPYWLVNPFELGNFKVDDQELIGKAENDPVLSALITYEVFNSTITEKVPVVYKFNDPVKGETYRPIAIVPPVIINPQDKQLLFVDNQPKTIPLNIKAFNEPVSGTIQVRSPEGWEISLLTDSIHLEENEEQTVMVTLKAGDNSSSGRLEFDFVSESQTSNLSLNVIQYDHIKTQYYFEKSAIELVSINLKKEGELVGYLEGAGDEVPDALELIGYKVEMLNEEIINNVDLSKYEAIIIGIRAFNTQKRLPYFKDKLFEYAENGGTVICQYNTSFRLVDEDVAPYPVTLSRSRITNEKAPLKILDPKHQVFNTPNKITEKDFNDWVQERGLYFPSSWAPEFTPLLEGSDDGEEPLQGGLLVAKYGEGYYVYTGLSFFRELPAGVPGAYRLFTNLISLGNGEVN
jgi:LmbE family N-acetylglucosaminyl deacetylase